MTKQTRFSPKVPERAVRLVQRHREEYETLGGDHLDCQYDRVFGGNAAKVGTAHGARHGAAVGLTTDEQAKLKSAGTREPGSCGANEILRKASAHFARAELDRR